MKATRSASDLAGIASLVLFTMPIPNSSRFSHPRTRTVGVVAALALSVAMIFSGCSGEDSRTEPPDDGFGAGPGDGSGGDGGGAGHGGSGGGDKDGGDGGGGGAAVDAGDGGESDAAPDGPIEYPVSDVACERDVAFRSNSISFVFPTAEAFGREVGRFLTDADQHRFVLAMRGSKGADADGAISAAKFEEGMGIYSFPVGPEAPTLASVSLVQGRFDSGTQLTGFLTFQDEEQSKNKTLQLTNIQFSAFTQSDCQQIVAMVDATLPASAANVGMQIRAGGEWHTLADLAGMKDSKGEYSNVPVRFLMVGEATSFDFSSF